MSVSPQPAPSTLPLYAIGVVLCLISFWLFYNVTYQRGWPAFSYVVFSIVIFVGSVKCFKAAHEADQKYAQDMKARADTHKSRVEFERHDVELGTVRNDAEYEAILHGLRQELELMRIVAEQKYIPLEAQVRNLRELITQQELVLRASYIQPASQYGITVDQYTSINEAKARNDMEDERKRIEAQNTMRLALEAEEAITKSQVKKRLFETLQAAVQAYLTVRHNAVYGENKDESAVLLPLYGSHVLALVEDYSGRGVIQAKTSKELERFIKVDSDYRRRNSKAVPSRQKQLPPSQSGNGPRW